MPRKRPFHASEALLHAFMNISHIVAERIFNVCNKFTEPVWVTSHFLFNLPVSEVPLYWD